MLAAKNRFHGHGSLRFVYSRGKIARSKYFIGKYTHNSRRLEPRVAVVVSKKVIKSAVKRNRIRRRIYEVIRLEFPKMIPQSDIVYIVVSSEVLIVSSQELKDSIERTLQTLGLYKPTEK